MIEQHLTFTEAAELIGTDVTAQTLRTWRDKGILRAVKVGRTWRVTAPELEVAINRLWQSSSSTARTPVTAPRPSRACAPTSGTSPGTKGDSAASVARAADLASELLRNVNSASTSSRDESRPKAPVIRLK